MILGLTCDGHKKVLSLSVGDNESSKYWLNVLNELKNRSVKDIMVICADGLTGIKEAINAAFPKTEYQRCNVHQVRNTLKYVADKDHKPFATPFTMPLTKRPVQKPLNSCFSYFFGFGVFAICFLQKRQNQYLFRIYCRRTFIYNKF